MVEKYLPPAVRVGPPSVLTLGMGDIFLPIESVPDDTIKRRGGSLSGTFTLTAEGSRIIVVHDATGTIVGTSNLEASGLRLPPGRSGTLTGTFTLAGVGVRVAQRTGTLSGTFTLAAAGEVGSSTVDPPYDIGFIVSSTSSPTTRESNIQTHLESMGHTVTRILQSATPITTSANSSHDLLIMSPDDDGTGFFNTSYVPDNANFLPFLDLAFNPYRRYVSPPNDGVAGTRFDFTYFEQNDVWLPSGSPILTDVVELTTGLNDLTASNYAHNLSMNEAVIQADPYTALAYFALGDGSGPRANTIASFFVPAGATIVDPDDLSSTTMTSPYIYFNMYNLAGAFWANLNADGDELLERLLFLLMNPPS